MTGPASFSGYILVCCLLVVLILVSLSFFDAPREGPISKGSHARAPHSDPVNQVQKEAIQADVSRLLNTSVHRRPAMIAMLRPVYAALLQERPGELSQEAARYALHRLFVRRHGWDVRGLRPEAKYVDSHMLVYIATAIDALGAASRGVLMHELAAVAAVIEELAHLDAVEKLRESFLEAVEMSAATNASFAHTRTGDVPEDYLALAVALTMSHHPSKDVVDDLMTSAWNGDDSVEWDIQKFYAWLLDTQFTIAHREHSLTNPFAAPLYGFDFAVRVVAEVGDQHGRWQDLECRTLKDTLVDLDTTRLGRVPLPEFYGAQIYGNVPPPFQFIETEEYLRFLGALDQSVPGQPGLMIPNYVNSYSNCLLSTDVYSVCCIDECEALLGHIETKVAEPSGHPGLIANIVANLPSDTVAAPRNLSTALVKRLESIVDADGKVPLHSRFFAQWLHHAYPYECAYPHPQGSVEETEVMQQTADAWFEEEQRQNLQGVMEISGDQLEEAYASAHERHSLAASELDMNAETDLLWTGDDMMLFESLLPPVIPPAESTISAGSILSVLPLVVLCAAAMRTVWAMGSSLQRASILAAGAMDDKPEAVMI